ncbi:MAG: tRNA (adenosine(37)-N6)-dimethylallyltransferase MiaA, partial [Planctomycetota bacterium]
MSAPAVFIVTGPTAGGKAAFARKVAARFDVPVLSLDSMKIYSGMDIGTAKPTPELIRSTPFHLVNLRDPWQPFSIGEYLDELQKLLPSLPSPLVLSGGTTFYLNAILDGIFEGPAAQPEIRDRLEAEAAQRGVEVLYERLTQLDPDVAANIQSADLRRIVRALEVIEVTGERFSVLQKQRKPFFAPGTVRVFGFARPRNQLYDRINERVVRMFDAGWVDEVARLLQAHDPPWGEAASQSIGYAQIAAALRAGTDPRGEIEGIQNRTRRFARGQLKWLRRLPVEWWQPHESDRLLDHLEELHGRFRKGESLGETSPERAALNDSPLRSDSSENVQDRQGRGRS